MVHHHHGHHQHTISGSKGHTGRLVLFSFFGCLFFGTYGVLVKDTSLSFVDFNYQVSCASFLRGINYFVSFHVSQEMTRPVRAAIMAICFYS